MVKKLINRLLTYVIEFIVSVLYSTLKPLNKYLKIIIAIVRMAIWKKKLKSCGMGTLIYPHVIIHAPNNVSLGENVSLVDYVHIWGSGGVSIGDYSIIAAHAIITSITHESESKLYALANIKRPVIIGKNVWIGSGAIILPGVAIGNNAIIGAGSVVTKNVEANTTVVGIPAKVVRNNMIKRDVPIADMN